jgi:hypothetical protein
MSWCESTPSMCRIRSSQVVAGRSAGEVRSLYMTIEFTGGLRSGPKQMRVKAPECVRTWPSYGRGRAASLYGGAHWPPREAALEDDITRTSPDAYSAIGPTHGLTAIRSWYASCRTDLRASATNRCRSWRKLAYGWRHYSTNMTLVPKISMKARVAALAFLGGTGSGYSPSAAEICRK